MSLDQLEAAIVALKPADRQRLALWFEQNRQELLGDDGNTLSEQQRDEVLRRREQALAHPELLERWDGTIERIRQRLRESGRQKASAR